jgi:hypothetical protein
LLLNHSRIIIEGRVREINTMGSIKRNEFVLQVIFLIKVNFR